LRQIFANLSKNFQADLWIAPGKRQVNPEKGRANPEKGRVRGKTKTPETRMNKGFPGDPRVRARKNKKKL